MHKTLAYYEDNAKHLSQRYESAMVDNIHALLLKTFLITSRLLEIGCGSGRDASFTTMSESEWISYREKHDMQLEHKEVTTDWLDRDNVIWLTCIMKKIVN